MRKHVLTGVAFAVATIALNSVPASACSWRGCGGYDYNAPGVYGYYSAPRAYGYAPPPAYGYYPPAPVYGYAPPPAYGYYPPAPVYGSGYYRSYYRTPAYGYRDVGWRRW